MLSAPWMGWNNKRRGDLTKPRVPSSTQGPAGSAGPPGFPGGPGPKVRATSFPGFIAFLVKVESINH